MTDQHCAARDSTHGGFTQIGDYYRFNQIKHYEASHYPDFDDRATALTLLRSHTSVLHLSWFVSDARQDSAFVFRPCDLVPEGEIVARLTELTPDVNLQQSTDPVVFHLHNGLITDLRMYPWLEELYDFVEERQVTEF